MKIQSCVITLSVAGVIVFCAWCFAATRFPEGGGIKIQGPGGIKIDAQLGGSNHQKTLPPTESGEVHKPSR